ncbi:MAG: 6-carboxytetrahydropterin synthase QueD [Chlamydiales bacterium]
MYIIEKKFHFEAGHILTYHDGKCARPHGHNYVLVIKVKGETLNSSGPKKNMIYDFQNITDIVKPMIKEYLDHHWLNDTLNTDSPTAEYIAKWIFEYLKDKISYLYSITIEETETAKATYIETF